MIYLEKSYFFRKISAPIIAFMGLVSLITPCYAETTMKTIDSFINDNPKALNDLPSLQYIFSRCAGLNVAIAKAFINETDPEYVALGNKYRLAYEKFAKAAINMSVSQNKSAEEGANYATKTIVQISNLYVDRMTDGRLRFGSFLEDAVIKSDLPTCDALNKTK